MADECVCWFASHDRKLYSSFLFVFHFSQYLLLFLRYVGDSNLDEHVLLCMQGTLSAGSKPVPQLSKK